MTVSELIEFLESQDPDAQVLFMGQPNYPFEFSIRGGTTRGEIRKASEGALDDDLLDEDEDPFKEGLKHSDVFLIEGSQLRYGDRIAWDVV